MRTLDDARNALDRAEKALCSNGSAEAIQALDDAIVTLFQARGALVFESEHSDWYAPRRPADPPRGWTPGDAYGIWTPEQRRAS